VTVKQRLEELLEEIRAAKIIGADTLNLRGVPALPSWSLRRLFELIEEIKTTVYDEDGGFKLSVLFPTDSFSATDDVLAYLSDAGVDSQFDEREVGNSFCISDSVWVQIPPPVLTAILLLAEQITVEITSDATDSQFDETAAGNNFCFSDSVLPLPKPASVSETLFISQQTKSTLVSDVADNLVSHLAPLPDTILLQDTVTTTSPVLTPPSNYVINSESSLTDYVDVIDVLYKRQLITEKYNWQPEIVKAIPTLTPTANNLRVQDKLSGSVISDPDLTLDTSNGVVILPL
jgi:hypothetical protein